VLTGQRFQSSANEPVYILFDDYTREVPSAVAQGGAWQIRIGWLVHPLGLHDRTISDGPYGDRGDTSGTAGGEPG
jgi:hypothetical protein